MKHLWSGSRAPAAAAAKSAAAAGKIHRCRRRSAGRVRGQHHGHHTYTYYYVTFEVDSGDRMELGVEDAEYGLLVEGDRGRLTFQGTRFLGFERTY